MRVAWLLSAFVSLIVVTGVSVSVRKTESEDPFPGEPGTFSNYPLRSLTLSSSQHVTKMVAPLQQWADAHGYRILVGSPRGQPDSIMIEIWNGKVVISATDRLGNGGSVIPGLDLFVYWNGDVADEALLDIVFQQMVDVLSPFGSIEAKSAPSGTPPRERMRNHW